MSTGNTLPWLRLAVPLTLIICLAGCPMPKTPVIPVDPADVEPLVDDPVNPGQLVPVTLQRVSNVGAYSVQVGTAKAAVAYGTRCDVTFVVPSDLPPGDHVLVIRDASTGTVLLVRRITVSPLPKAVPAEAPIVPVDPADVDPLVGDPVVGGQSVSVAIGTPTAASEVLVFVGTTPADVLSSASKTVTFRVPTTLAPGTYGVGVFHAKSGAVLAKGAITIAPAP
jgi:hypothetical protein